MGKQRLQCLFFPDLASWEKLAIQPVLEGLSKECEIESHDVTDGDQGMLKKLRSGKNEVKYWVISRQWRRALRFLGVSNQANLPVYVSVFDLSTPRTSLSQLILRQFMPSIPPGVNLIAHSPLNFRFFKEMESLSPDRTFHLPLPLPELGIPKKESGGTKVSVGTFAPFVTESNLNYFLGVAHYLSTKTPHISFRILGTGGLYAHISQMVSDLELEKTVDVVETNNLVDVADLDIFLYGPLRNDHFLPLLIAGAQGIPVLANEITGIDQFVTDGHTGFLVPIHEIKTMAELVIRLSEDKTLRSAMGSALKEKLVDRFSYPVLAESYESVFFPRGGKGKPMERAA